MRGSLATLSASQMTDAGTVAPGVLSRWEEGALPQPGLAWGPSQAQLGHL